MASKRYEQGVQKRTSTVYFLTISIIARRISFDKTTGVGLMIVQEAAEDYSGDVGAMFAVYLPEQRELADQIQLYNVLHLIGQFTD